MCVATGARKSSSAFAPGSGFRFHPPHTGDGQDSELRVSATREQKHRPSGKSLGRPRAVFESAKRLRPGRVKMPWAHQPKRGLRVGLLQLARNAAKRRVQLRAKTIDDRYDGDGDACGDQAVFDCSRTAIFV